MVSTGLNGGSFGDILGSGIKGAFFGAAAGALGFAAGLAAPAGAISGFLYGGMSSVAINGVMNAVQDRPIFESAGLSFALGGAGGAIGGYYKAQNMGLNPITGTPKQSVLAESVDASIDKAQVAFDKSVRAQTEPTDMGNTAPAKVYRGGTSMELSKADIKTTMGKASGLMEPELGGLSVNSNPKNPNVASRGAFEVNTKTLPKGLQLINKPAGSTHYIITPTYSMPQNTFQALLNDVEINPMYNSIFD